MNFDEKCLTCGYSRGDHRTEQLHWWSISLGDVAVWQEGLCPDGHNSMQPAWDKYLFHGRESGFPYRDEVAKIRRSVS